MYLVMYRNSLSRLYRSSQGRWQGTFSVGRVLPHNETSSYLRNSILSSPSLWTFRHASGYSYEPGY